MKQSLKPLIRLVFVLIMTHLHISCSEDSILDPPVAESGELVAIINGEVFRTKEATAEVILTMLQITVPLQNETDDELDIALRNPTDQGDFLINDSSNNTITYWIGGSPAARAVGQEGVLTLTKIDQINNIISGTMSNISIGLNTINIDNLSFTDLPLIDETRNVENLGANHFYFEIDGQAEAISKANSTGESAKNYGPMGEYLLTYWDYLWDKSSFTGNQNAVIRFVVKAEGISTSDAYSAFMKLGELPFGKTDDSPEENKVGAVITYTDRNGILWSTDFDDGDQAASTIVLTERSRIPNTYMTLLKGTFECTLYDGFGNSIKLRNGQFAANSMGLYIP